MNRARMLEKCRRDQWKPSDLDWSGKPRAMSRDDEIAIVQYFVDMSAIERLAGELFEVERAAATDPVLAEIFATFVEDEKRHSRVARMLADYYDVHHYKTYEENPHLRRFAPHFIALVRRAPPELANAFITGGELFLDVALLRSLDDYVADPMMRSAMMLINRDESRHVAVDFHMVEHYSSDAYLAEARARGTLRGALATMYALSRTSFYSRPFFRAVFFEPMQVLDPTGKRMHEAMKRFQLLGAKPDVARQPMAKALRALQTIIDTPVLGRVFSTVFSRALLVEPELFRRLTSADEERRAATRSFDDLASDAIGRAS